MDTHDHPQIEKERWLTTMRDIGNLAKELGVSKDYVSAMKFNGFAMPGGKASIRMARKFLKNCPEFSVRKSRNGFREVKDEGGSVVAIVHSGKRLKGHRQEKPQPSAGSSGK